MTDQAIEVRYRFEVKFAILFPAVFYVEDAMVIDDDNPYAAPKAEVLAKDQYLDSSTDAWRDGILLVVRKGAELTDRCLKCAAPTKGYRDQFSRSLSWHRPIWFVLFFVYWPLYVIVYLFVRWRARVTVALCPLHRRKRRRAIALAWLAALTGVGLWIASAMFTEAGHGSGPQQWIAVIAGIILVFGGIIGGMFGSQVLVPRRIDRHFVWLGKVSPDYLAALPDWNGPGDDLR